MDQRISQAITESKNILVLPSHSDADSIASGILMKHILEKIGKQVRLVQSEEPGSKDMQLPYIQELEVTEPALLDFSLYDLVVTLDAAGPYQIVGIKYRETFYFPQNTTILCIDHHETRTSYETYAILDPNASSTSELVFKYFVKPVGENETSYATYDLNKDESTLLLAGIIDDTGNFTWHCTPDTFFIAGELLHAGADLDFLVHISTFQKPVEYNAYLSYVLPKIEFYPKLSLMILTLHYDKLKENGIEPEKVWEFNECYQFNIARSYKGYSLSALFMVKEDGMVLCRMRGNNFENRIDIGKLARAMEPKGGGHFNAGGFNAKVPFDKIKQKFMQQIILMRANNDDVS